MTEKARFEKTERGRKPAGPGWFVIHTSEAPWGRSPRFGTFCNFEGDTKFEQIGVNIHVLAPKQPACMYHREDAQEDFLVLSGECRVLIEEEEHRLKAGHFVHCPPGTNHVFVGGDDGPCTILMLGGRAPDLGIVYPVSPLAAKHGASVEMETPDPRVAYAGTPPVEWNQEPLWPKD